MAIINLAGSKRLVVVANNAHIVRPFCLAGNCVHTWCGCLAVRGGVVIKAPSHVREDHMKLVSVSTLVARRVVISILAAFVLAVAFPQAGFAQSDPKIGTWKLNLARSTFTPGPAPRSATLNFQGAGANLTNTSESINAQGAANRTVYKSGHK